MRYAIVSRGLSRDRLEAEALKVGAEEIRTARLLNQVFCELDDEQAEALSRIPGLTVKPVKEYRADQVSAAPPAVETFSQVFQLLRSYFAPPLTGAGLTVAVLDTGVRKTHRSLRGKVVYEANCTDSPASDDVFGHGTQVAFVVCGGQHGEEKAGVSPGAWVMNIKVINDEGVGTDESVVDGIDLACDLAKRAKEDRLQATDKMYPNIVNLSLGGEDDGDPENPVRAACRQAISDYGLEVVAAAGNFGPKMTTIAVPACDPEVVAVGALQTLSDFEIWERSSRGPTVQGETKPDFVMWGTDLEMASNKADDEYVTKSGTSFAAPMLSGLTGLLWESGRRAYGDWWQFRWTEARKVAPFFCVKSPEGALKKDNTYGFGLPAMGSMLTQMARPILRPEEALVRMLPLIAMVGLMRGVVRIS